jgi:hypothetical protein
MPFRSWLGRRFAARIPHLKSEMWGTRLDGMSEEFRRRVEKDFVLVQKA